MLLDGVVAISGMLGSVEDGTVRVAETDAATEVVPAADSEDG